MGKPNSCNSSQITRKSYRKDPDRKGGDKNWTRDLLIQESYFTHLTAHLLISHIQIISYIAKSDSKIFQLELLFHAALFIL